MIEKKSAGKAERRRASMRADKEERGRDRARERERSEREEEKKKKQQDESSTFPTEGEEWGEMRQWECGKG